MKYYIIAGEASGDLHGSNLMKGLLAEDPDARIRFWGGDLMAAAGGTIVRHYRDCAIMGVGEVISKAGKLLGNLSFCKDDLLAWNPDVVILIDYPGFNFKIAKFAHAKGLKVYYYIAPKTWASRENRNRKLKAWVDRLFIVFPFEIPYFEKKGIPFTYVGNPLVDAVDDSPAVKGRREDFLSAHSLQDRPFLAILPGSRKGEISRTMPVAMEVADRLHARQEYADRIFLVAGAPSRTESDYLGFIGDRDYVKLVFGDTYGILKNSSSAIINSGTASLEAVLIGTPQVVVWSTSKFNEFIGKHILKILDHIKYISLGNLIADKAVFRELIQWDFTVDKVALEIERIESDPQYRGAMEDGYAAIRAALGGSGASAAIARAMYESLIRIK